MIEERDDDPRDGAGKGPDAFRTISEVAEELGLPQHVLRFWETRFPQIKPVKRGGGRRYYRPGDVDLLRGVKELLYGKGYTIRGVQRILREQGGRKEAQAAGLAAAGREPDEGAPAGHDQLEVSAQQSGPEAWAPVRRPPAPQVLEVDPKVDLAAYGVEQGQPAATDEPSARHEPEVPAAPRLTTEQTAKLAAALDDMTACRRLLEGRG